MGVARDEDIGVELALHGPERLRVAPGHELVTVDDSNLEVPDSDQLGLWQRVGDPGQRDGVIKVATHAVHLRGERAQVVERRLVCDVARAQDARNLAGHEQRLELVGQLGRAVRDVQVAEHEHEHLGRIGAVSDGGHGPANGPKSPYLALSARPRGAPVEDYRCS